MTLQFRVFSSVLENRCVDLPSSLLTECFRIAFHEVRVQLAKQEDCSTPGNIWLLSSIKFQLALNLDLALKYLLLLDEMNS